MFRRMWFVAALAFFAGAAHAEPFKSDSLGFTADFPASPTVGVPEGSEKDQAGNIISHSVMVSDKLEGSYFAAVLVDSFDVPHVINVPQSLQTERDAFLKPLNGSVDTANRGMLDGNDAMFFTFTTSDGSSAGGGVVSIVAGDKPRIYLLVTLHTANATAAQLAALDKFTQSLHVMHKASSAGP